MYCSQLCLEITFKITLNIRFVDSIETFRVSNSSHEKKKALKSNLSQKIFLIKNECMGVLHPFSIGLEDLYLLLSPYLPKGFNCAKSWVTSTWTLYIGRKACFGEWVSKNKCELRVKSRFQKVLGKRLNCYIFTTSSRLSRNTKSLIH